MPWTVGIMHLPRAVRNARSLVTRNSTGYHGGTQGDVTGMKRTCSSQSKHITQMHLSYVAITVQAVTQTMHQTA